MIIKSRGNALQPLRPCPMPRSNHSGNPDPPKLGSNRPQGAVLASDCFLIYPFQLERNRREYVPLSKPVGAPVPVTLPPASLHHKL